MKKIPPILPHRLRALAWMGVFVCGCFAAPSLCAQDFANGNKEVAPPKASSSQHRITWDAPIPLQSSLSQHATQQTLVLSKAWLPEFAKSNPSGHSYLCRVETSLESQMKMPLWIRAGEMPAIPQAGTGNIYVRWKLLRF